MKDDTSGYDRHKQTIYMLPVIKQCFQTRFEEGGYLILGLLSGSLNLHIKREIHFKILSL